MGPYYDISCNNNKDSEVMHTFECFGTTAQLLRSTKRAKLEHLSSITIGYLILQKDSKHTEDYTRLKILLDSGCAATLINHSIIRKLKTSKDKKPTGLPKEATSVPVVNAWSILHYQHCMNTKLLLGTVMWINLIQNPAIMI